MKARPTIRDVAKRAGVSTTTVSFVLNDNPNETISPPVRQRVWEVARALNYQPSAAASALSRKRTRNVALIFYKDDDVMANNFYSFVVQGAIKEATENDYNLLFSYIESTYTGFGDLPKSIREKNADGALCVRHTDPKMIHDIQSLGIPIVAVDNQPLIRSINTAQIDNERGGILASECLRKLGHRRVACLMPRNPPPSLAERMEGFRIGLEQHGLKFDAKRHVLWTETLSFEAAFDTARALFAKARVPTAIFCGNDEMAAAVLRAARQAGRHVPNELSVIGFDDVWLSRYVDPPLTTIGVEKERLGRRAMGRLLQVVEGNDETIRTERVPVELILRGSVGPVGRSRV
jgi:LacI family transcriptional regulator